MAQMLTREATPTAPTGVITVADLLSRYAPALPVDPDPPTVPVSVASLLRREGRPAEPEYPPVPAAAPERADYEDEPAGETRGGTGMLVRRGAIAAGTLLLVGAAFGAAVVHDASSVSDEARALTDYPGQGRLDSRPTPTGAVPTVVGQAAQTGALDPGADAPSSWMGTAFPDAAGGATAGATDTTPTAGGGSVSPSATAGDDPVTGESARAVPPVDGGQGDRGADTPDSGSDDQDAGGLGRAVGGVGDGVGGPVGGSVSSVGGAVDGAGDSLSESSDDGMVGSVAGLAGSLL